MTTRSEAGRPRGMAGTVASAMDRLRTDGIVGPAGFVTDEALAARAASVEVSEWRELCPITIFETYSIKGRGTVVHANPSPPARFAVAGSVLRQRGHAWTVTGVEQRGSRGLLVAPLDGWGEGPELGEATLEVGDVK